MILRLIFWGFVFYYGYRLLARVLGTLTGSNKPVENIQKKKPPLDLRDDDVEDVDFEDIT